MSLNKREIRQIGLILLLALFSRLFLYITAYFGENLFASYTQRPNYQISDSTTKLDLPGSLLATHLPSSRDLSKFDANWYVNIASSGYDKLNIHSHHPPANWVFFPLFPLLLGILHRLFSFLDYYTTGIILANICFALSLIYLFLIAGEKHFGSNQLGLLMFFVLMYPSSLYFSVPYTESLFLLLSAATVYYTLKGRYNPAFILAGLSTITRVPGFINMLFVFSCFLTRRPGKLRNNLLYIPSIILSLLPMTLFLIYMRSVSGDLLAPFHEQSLNWFRHTTIPFLNYLRYIWHPYFIASGGWDNGLISFIISTSVFLVYGIHLIKQWPILRKNKEELFFFIYGFLLVVVPFSSSSRDLTSIVRYLMVAFPFYFYLADNYSSKNSVMKALFGFLFITLNQIITIAYINNYFFTV